MTLNEAKTEILVTACTTQGQPWIFRKEEERNYKLWELARATSAAPLYFPAFQPTLGDQAQEGQPHLIDGGLWTNNPSPLITANIVKKYLDGNFAPEKIFLLSLGTGDTPFMKIPKKAGLVQAAYHSGAILDTFMSSHSRGNHETMAQLLGKKNYFRVNPKLDRAIGLDDVSKTAFNDLNTAAKKPHCDEELSRFVEATADIIRQKLEQ